MRIYIACHSRELAESVAARVRADGHETTSTWHTKPFNPTESHTVAQRHGIAIEDLNDIRRADALLLVGGPEKYSGGKFVEAGIAYGLGKAVYVEGRFENMLTYLFQPWGET